MGMSYSHHQQNVVTRLSYSNYIRKYFQISFVPVSGQFGSNVVISFANFHKSINITRMIFEVSCRLIYLL